MKRFPQIDRFFTAVCSFAILALFVLLSSCEKDSLQDDFSRIKTSNLSTAAFVSEPNNNVVDCPYPSVCIKEGSGEYYVKSDFISEINGSNEKKIIYNAYNTEEGYFIVEVKYENTNSAKANIEINIEGDNNGPYYKNGLVDGDIESYTYQLPNDWQPCQIINFSINASFDSGVGRGSNQNDFNFGDLNYFLIGVCSSTCDESFSYEEKQNQDGTYYSFTYVSSEDLEGAEVKFTCPHITGFSAIDGKEYDVNPGNSHGSPTVLTWTGDIEACTEITFDLSFDADCAQTNSGKANLFTDFKVNGESKKGDNENIVYQCN